VTTGGGGFTSASGIPAVERPMGIATPGMKIPKKKDRKTVVREAAQRVVDRLLDDEQSHPQTS
jgi:hypothetical protein